jgi:hypothetical protein
MPKNLKKATCPLLGGDECVGLAESSALKAKLAAHEEAMRKAVYSYDRDWYDPRDVLNEIVDLLRARLEEQIR